MYQNRRNGVCPSGILGPKARAIFFSSYQNASGPGAIAFENAIESLFVARKGFPRHPHPHRRRWIAFYGKGPTGGGISIDLFPRNSIQLAASSRTCETHGGSFPAPSVLRDFSPFSTLRFVVYDGGKPLIGSNDVPDESAERFRRENRRLCLFMNSR